MEIRGVDISFQGTSINCTHIRTMMGSKIVPTKTLFVWTFNMDVWCSSLTFAKWDFLKFQVN